MTYVMKCKKCGAEFDIIVNEVIEIGKKPEGMKCEKCDSEDIERTFSACNFRIRWGRGRGFFSAS